MPKTILITGTSTGVGLQTAVLLAMQGHNVYATMRDTSKQERLGLLINEHRLKVNIMQLDVKDNKSIEACIMEISKNEDQLDVLINNAGSGFIRPAELATLEEIHEVMDVNFYGPIRCIKAVLPVMRRQKSGHIINVSSVGGLVGQPLNEIYCAAKFALEGLTESMASYLYPYFNIHMSLIEPGGIMTEFSNLVVKNFEATGGVGNSQYEPVFTDYMNYRNIFTDEVKARVFQTPQQVAEVIAACIDDPHPALRYLTSDSAREFTQLKTGLDVTGGKLQNIIRERILGK